MSININKYKIIIWILMIIFITLNKIFPLTLKIMRNNFKIINKFKNKMHFNKLLKIKIKKLYSKNYKNNL